LLHKAPHIVPIPGTRSIAHLEENIGASRMRLESSLIERVEALITPRVNASYTAKQYFDAANSAEVAQLDNVTLLNASVTYAIGAWKLRGGVNNLTDEQYRWQATPRSPRPRAMRRSSIRGRATGSFLPAWISDGCRRAAVKS